MIFATTPALVVPSQMERAAISDLPKTMAAHDDHLAAQPFMTQIEVGGTAASPDLTFPFSVAAWNLERCLFARRSAEKLSRAGAEVVLLSEMDNGMARTAQANTTAQLASHLGMSYAYGVEFLELGLGSDTERGFCTDAQNAKGFHGNALMARGALHRPFLLRLPGARHWFLQGGDQPRLGERMAIGAVIQTTSGPLVAASTHLESVSDAPGREAQLAALIDALEAQFAGLPILIGGDLNTGNNIGGDHRDETLFAHATARGFALHGGDDITMTTRPSLITRWPDRAMKLDWFLSRGVTIDTVQIIPSLDDDGCPLSDHDLITARVTGLASA